MKNYKEKKEVYCNNFINIDENFWKLFDNHFNQFIAKPSNRSSSKKKNNSSGVLKLCWSFAATLISLSKFMYESLSKRKKSFNVLE